MGKKFVSRPFSTEFERNAASTTINLQRSRSATRRSLGKSKENVLSIVLFFFRRLRFVL